MKADDVLYFKANDGLAIRRAVWRAASPRGTVALFGGRTEFMEKYEEVIQRLLARNLTVHSMDWRGQGLSGRMLGDRHKGHVERFEDYMDDLEAFLQLVDAGSWKRPVICMAQSMGCNIVLRYLLDEGDAFDAAVLVSPMIAIFSDPFLRLGARLTARTAVAAGMKDRYAPGYRGYNPGEPFKNNPLTHDPARFAASKEAIRRNPDLAIGGPTFGWLLAAFASIDKLIAPGAAHRVPIPVLMAVGDDERVVSGREQRRFGNAVPDARVLSIPKARHEILMETDGVQAVFWKAFDAFLERFPGA